MGSVQVKIKNLKDVKKQLDKMQKAPKKVQEMTAKDFKKRAPGWVSDEVRKEYNIKKADVKPIRVKGDTLSTVTIVYKGKLLTPVHFSMTPKAPNPGRGYTLKATIKKGDRKTLGQVKKLSKKQRQNIGRNFTHQSTRSSSKSPIMLMHTGNKKAGGTNYIPFQRQSQRRNDLKAIKTLSIPQMVSNPKVEENIQAAISEKLGERLTHHFERYIGK